MADKIKEKAPVRKELKEKVKAAPKELLRRGLDDGTQRLRGQLRDAAQHGQRDGYGSDQIEDAAWRGGRWGERGIEKLLKKKKADRSKRRDTGPSVPPEAPTEPPSSDGIHSDPPKYPVPADGTERVRIKTREAITSRNRGIAPSQNISRDSAPVPEPARPQIKMWETTVRDIRRDVRTVSPDRTEPPQIRTRESVAPEPPASVRPALQSGLEPPRVKTRESTVHSPAVDARPIRQRESEFPPIKTRQSIALESPVSVRPDARPSPDRPPIKTRASTARASPVHVERVAACGEERPPERSFIKTKEAYVGEHPTAVLDQRSQAVEQGRQKFRRERWGKPEIRRVAEQQVTPEPPPVPAAGQEKRPVQRFASWRQITQRVSTPVMANGRAVSPTASSGQVAAKMPGVDKKSVGRTAGQAVKTVKQGTKQALRSVEGVKVVGNTAQSAPLARRGAVQAVRAVQKPAVSTVRSAAKAGTAALRATVRAAQTLAAALTAGGSVVVSVILLLCLVGILVASPFGIFLADDSPPNAISPSAAAAQINGELSDYLSALQAGGTYDRVEVIGGPPSWVDVFAVFAAKTAGGGAPVAVLDPDAVELLRAVFWDMTKITTAEADVEHPAEGGGAAWTEKVLTITITPRTPDDMRVFYSFTEQQNTALDELLSGENSAMWQGLLYDSSDIVAVALSQVGNAGGRPYWSWYGFSDHVNWCACFVSWCANECGYIDAGVVPKFASCSAGARWFKLRGLWQDGSCTPSPGDLIFFDWDEKGSSGPQNDSPDHVGIVEQVEGGIIYTVEGNSSDRCRQRSYSVGHYEIWGYGCPNYS